MRLLIALIFFAISSATFGSDKPNPGPTEISKDWKAIGIQQRAYLRCKDEARSLEKAGKREESAKMYEVAAAEAVWSYTEASMFYAAGMVLIKDVSDSQLRKKKSTLRNADWYFSKAIDASLHAISVGVGQLDAKKCLLESRKSLRKVRKLLKD